MIILLKIPLKISNPIKIHGDKFMIPTIFTKSRKSYCSTLGVGVDGGGSVSKKFNVKVFYVMGKALSGKLSCPCDRSCSYESSLPWIVTKTHNAIFCDVIVELKF